MIGQKQQDHILILIMLPISLLKEDRIPHPLHLPPLLLLTTLREDNWMCKQHFQSNSQEPLHIIINGTAGTGKSYLINCLRLLLGDSVRVAAPTGVASFIIEGRTLHSLLHLPVRGDFKEMGRKQSPEDAR